MPTKEIDEFRVKLREQSVLFDPVTSQQPQNERELSASLAVAHVSARLDWSRVALWAPDDRLPLKRSPNQRTMADLIDLTDSVFCEYPLFANDSDESGNTWGGMSADLLFIRRTNRSSPAIERITQVEAKIDSEFTYSNDPHVGQISRYLKYLSKYCPPESGEISANLVLVCPDWNHNWYAEKLRRFKDAFEKENQNPNVGIYIALWNREDGGVFP